MCGVWRLFRTFVSEGPISFLPRYSLQVFPAFSETPGAQSAFDGLCANGAFDCHGAVFAVTGEFRWILRRDIARLETDDMKFDTPWPG